MPRSGGTSPCKPSSCSVISSNPGTNKVDLDPGNAGFAKARYTCRNWPPAVRDHRRYRPRRVHREADRPGSPSATGLLRGIRTDRSRHCYEAESAGIARGYPDPSRPPGGGAADNEGTGRNVRYQTPNVVYLQLNG